MVGQDFKDERVNNWRKPLISYYISFHLHQDIPEAAMEKPLLISSSPKSVETSKQLVTEVLANIYIRDSISGSPAAATAATRKATAPGKTFDL